MGVPVAFVYTALHMNTIKEKMNLIGVLISKMD